MLELFCFCVFVCGSSVWFGADRFCARAVGVFRARYCTILSVALEGNWLWICSGVVHPSRCALDPGEVAPAPGVCSRDRFVVGIGL